MLLELVGGPLDGAELTRSSRPEPFVWIGPDSVVRRAPAAGAHLYRAFATRRDPLGVRRLRYRFAGFETARCDECGWFGPRRDGICLMCDAALAH